jgi:hypothetical protein
MLWIFVRDKSSWHYAQDDKSYRVPMTISILAVPGSNDKKVTTSQDDRSREYRDKKIFAEHAQLLNY